MGLSVYRIISVQGKQQQCVLQTFYFVCGGLWLF